MDGGKPKRKAELVAKRCTTKQTIHASDRDKTKGNKIIRHPFLLYFLVLRIFWVLWLLDVVGGARKGGLSSRGQTGKRHQEVLV